MKGCDPNCPGRLRPPEDAWGTCILCEQYTPEPGREQPKPVGQAIFLYRPSVAERIRGTRLDVLPAVTAEGDEVWIADGDTSELLLRISAGYGLDTLIETLVTARRMLATKPRERDWYGEYPPKGFVK